MGIILARFEIAFCTLQLQQSEFLLQLSTAKIIKQVLKTILLRKSSSDHSLPTEPQMRLLKIRSVPVVSSFSSHTIAPFCQESSPSGPPVS